MILDQPDLRPIGKGKYRLAQNYTYEWEDGGNLKRLTVYEGFVSDIASVPTVFWPLGFPPDGLHRAAALLHDWLYKHRGKVPNPDGCQRVFSQISGEWVSVHGAWTREEADRLFGRIMREADVPQWRRRAMFTAVHFFGGFFW